MNKPRIIASTNVDSKTKKLHFLIIGPETDNTKDLVVSIEGKGHEALVLGLKEIAFVYDKGDFMIKARGDNLEDIDIVIFRAFNIRSNEAKILAHSFLEKGKVVIDEAIGRGFVPGKIYEASCLAKYSLNHPTTVQLVSKEADQGLVTGLKYPVVVKPVDGQKGQGVVKYDNPVEVIKHLGDSPSDYLVQEYLPIKSDYRVMVVGEEAIGAIERIVPAGEFRSNTSLGAKSKKGIITPEMEKIAVAAAQALGYEVAGVDIAQHASQWYILEVNHTPQWQNVKRLCGVNPAEYIIDYALSKYEKA